MNFSKRTLLVLMTVGLVGWTVASTESKKEAKKPAAKGGAKAGTKGETPAPKSPAPAQDEAQVEAALRRSAEGFAAACNAHDPQAVAAGFLPDGEFVDGSGQVIRGREAIQAHFADGFTVFPESQIKLIVETVRVIGPGVAIEEGVVETMVTPKHPVEVSRYVALHVQQGDAWLVARSRDFPAETPPPTNHDRLLPLAWLKGDWVDESAQATIRTSCQWADNNNYLLQQFEAQVAGKISSNGSTRIGWDPLTQHIKSWTFDSDGGYSEALWTEVDGAWILKSHGVTQQGETSSATTIIRPIDADTLSWESHDRVVGGELVDDIDPIIVKRRPPSPGE
ncbi:MAG: SgcJ/EcaC family oxidoreductase [Planctomycetales bacterium]